MSKSQGDGMIDDSESYSERRKTAAQNAALPHLINSVYSLHSHYYVSVPPEQFFQTFGTPISIHTASDAEATRQLERRAIQSAYLGGQDAGEGIYPQPANSWEFSSIRSQRQQERNGGGSDVGEDE